MSFGNRRICSICGKEKSTLALKRLRENIWICSKGRCRELYDANKSMEKEYSLNTVIQVCKMDL